MLDSRQILDSNKTQAFSDFFTKLAAKAQTSSHDPFLLLESDTKIFKSTKPTFNSKMTLEKALSLIEKENKMIDVTNDGDKKNMYWPTQLISSLSKQIKRLSCILNDDYLIVDFKKIKNYQDKPLGLRVFKIAEPDVDQNNDMIRRSDNL